MRMNLKKTALAAALSVAGLIGAGAAQASTLSTGDILAFTAGNSTCTSGSYFTMSGNCGAAEVPGLSGGIAIGKAQPTGASHTGAPTGSEDIATSIDQPWGFFGNTGLDFTITGTSAVTGTTINGVVPLSPTSLDFSNWRVTWNGISSIDMGGCVGTLCATGVTDSHTATFTWDGVYGDAFTLDYSAHVPKGSLSNFGGVAYGLHMVGVVTPAPVPIPAAAWLFGSGLIGLVGIARRKKFS